MNGNRLLLRAVSCTALSVGLLGAAMAQSGQGGSAPVTVVNTPLPVQITNSSSSLAVSNPGAIAAAISARQVPVMRSFERGDATTNSFSYPISPTVPAGTRLVISYLAMAIFSTVGQPVTSASCSIIAPVEGGIATVRILPGAIAGNNWSAAENGMFVLNAGETLSLHCSYTAGGGPASIRGVVSGFSQPVN